MNTDKKTTNLDFVLSAFIRVYQRLIAFFSHRFITRRARPIASPICSLVRADIGEEHRRQSALAAD
jgi:hypothetical protein